MSTTLKQIEAIPTSYPAVPSGLSAEATALDADMIWQRIESYIVHRWTARSVVWIVEGSGDWEAPLSPATISTVKVWQDNSWEVVTLLASALGGYELPTECPYQVTASVGGGTVPAGVNEAFRRLAEYMVDQGGGVSGATSSSHDIGAISISHNRSASWIARAMQNSGAGDLLRNYRRI